MRRQCDPCVRPERFLATNLLADLLRRTAAREPDSVAFIEGEFRLTFAEWDWLSDRAAYSLWAEGVRAGDVVALLLPNSITYPIAYLGAAKIGAVTAGINPRLGRREKEHVLDDTRAVALVTDDPDAPAPRILLTPDRLNRPGGEPPSADVAPSDPVAIVYTSGTEGLPKGAVFAASALEAVRRIESRLDPLDHPRGIQGIPMSHMGFMTKIAFNIERVATTVLMDQWGAREALEVVEREHITMIGGVPTQLALMLIDEQFPDTDLSSLRACTVGGAPAAPDLVRRIREGFGVPVAVRYSCTELALATGTRLGDADLVVAQTVGRALPEVDVLIESPGSDGVGETCVRSPAMFSGYWHDAEATRAAVDEHGYFHTGDLGRIDGDGNLHLAGRTKEMYIRGGYNVYPVEVENVMREHAKVRLVAVVGVPDDVLGERGRAYVVPADEADPPSAEELRAFVAARIADYKAPDEVVVRDELPLTPMFKVDKRALADSA